MKRAPFIACDASDQARNYLAVEDEAGNISITYGMVKIKPSPKLLASALIALQRQVPGLNTAEVIDLNDFR